MLRKADVMFLSLKLRKLHRPHESDRIQAIRHLHGERHLDAVAAVVLLLDDGSRAVRIEAAHALATMGWQPTMPAERVAVALILHDWEAVRRWGPDELEALVPLLKKGLAPSDEIARALAASTEPAVVGPLRELLRQDHVSEAVRLAAEALGRIDSPDAVDALIAGGGHWAHEALVASGASRLAERLSVALTQGDETTRATAAGVLAERPDPGSGPALIAAFREADHLDPEPFVAGRPSARRSLRVAISKLEGLLPFNALVAALHDDDEQVREMAADAIAKSGSDLAFETLKDAARREAARVPSVLPGILRAIVGLGDDRALRVIGEAIDAVVADKWVAAELLHGPQGLRQYGRDATPVVMLFLETHLREDAAIALGRLGDERAVETMVRYAGPAVVDQALALLVGQQHPGAVDWPDWWARRGRYLSQYKLVAPAISPGPSPDGRAGP